jgi:glycosyltransferase involved in cell wall biosynthesis
MKVLLVCPTYGRIPYLGRMVASFLSQNYDDKHLVIVNDDSNVELCCDIKNIIVININK